jgi:hypothetical protein
MLVLLAIKVLVFIAGFLLVAQTLLSAVRNFVLPRSAPDVILGFVFLGVGALLRLPVRLARSYGARDRIMAFYAPFGVLALLPAWLFLAHLGFSAMYWATGIESWADAFVLSGSSLLTLGFAHDNTLLHMSMSFVEATIGLLLVALLIAYLPTMYSTFSRRETAVTLMDVRAGTPPSVAEMVLRSHRIGKLDNYTGLWRDWEVLFSEIEETHTSLPALVFFRSPNPLRSWVTAAGCVLDAAAFWRSTLAVPHDPQADLCIRAGYLALRRIARFYEIDYNPDPHFPTDPLSVSRAEFDELCAILAAEGVPLVADLDQAWQDFGGWRVNYDRVLLALCSLTMAPPAPWSSDRAPRFSMPSRTAWIGRSMGRA